MPHKRRRSAAATDAAAESPGVHAAPIDAAQLPPSFVRFLAASGVDASVYGHAHTLPRYVRCNALRPPLLGAPALSAALGTAVAPVGWLPAGWYSLDCGAKIVGAEPYRNGRLYGLDADVDAQRLNTARNNARRYGVLGRGGADPEALRLARRQVWRGPLVRLVRADGTAFDLPPPAVDGDAKGEQAVEDEEGEEAEKEGGASSGSRTASPRVLYERVLVDAEWPYPLACTGISQASARAHAQVAEDRKLSKASGHG